MPPLIPETEEEKRRYEEAGERREYRLSQRRRVDAYASSSLYMYLMLLL